ncbi:hypothetical protein Bcon01_71720 [Burkholderia contaminans]|jgi:hypothetical protein|nr:hypothetical protein Bcon01_71720 [Burkholderia contaminans]
MLDDTGCAGTGRLHGYDERPGACCEKGRKRKKRQFNGGRHPVTGLPHWLQNLAPVASATLHFPHTTGPSDVAH